MYSIRPNLVIGFHGCDAETCNDLLNNPNEIVYSNRPYDWLGHGMYLRWSSFSWCRHSGKEPYSNLYSQFKCNKRIFLAKEGEGFYSRKYYKRTKK